MNYATEQATVTAPRGSISTDVLVDAVTSIGNHATPVVADSTPTIAPTSASAEEPGSRASLKDVEAERHVAELSHRLVVSTVLTVPMVIMSMIPAAQFDNWQWLALTLASPIAVRRLPRREDRDRRHHRVRYVGGRRVAADRRERPRRSDCGRPGHRRHGERGRTVGGAGDQGWC